MSATFLHPSFRIALGTIWKEGGCPSFVLLDEAVLQTQVRGTGHPPLTRSVSDHSIVDIAGIDARVR